MRGEGSSSRRRTDNKHDSRNIGGLENRMNKVSISNKNTTTKEVTFATNFIKLSVKKKFVHKYSVGFSPDIDSTSLRFKLLSQQESILGPVKSFDGGILYVPRKLPDDTMFCKSVLPENGREINLKFNFIESCETSKCYQLIGIIFKRILRYIKLERVGKGYYSPDLAIPIEQHNISLWPGYDTSVRSYDGGIMWNIDASFKLLRTESALDVMSDIYFKSSDFQKDCIQQLIGTVVITRYNNKTYRIDDIAWDKNPRSTFEWQNGKTISYVDYYKEIYGLTITDTDQPLLINRPKSFESVSKPVSRKDDRPPLTLICLIPEFCFVTGINDSMRKNFQLMKELSKHIHCSPSQRLKTIQALVDLVHNTKEASNELLFWGLSLDVDTHKIGGIVLPEETVYAKNPDEPLIVDNNTTWHNCLRNIKPISSPMMENWICVYTDRDSRVVDQFLSVLQNSVRYCSLRFGPPTLLTIKSDQTENYIKAIKNNISQNSECKLVMAIFPTQREDRYASFKKLLCCQSPVPSQAVLTSTISKPQRLNVVANRVALQINCKLGGELWRVNIPMKSIMVIGIDVHHCTISKSRNSTVGLVSSLNSECTKWFTRVTFQSQVGEIVETLRLFISQALSKYYEVNHVLPQKVFVFRDGVGDGQIEASIDFEVKHILSAFESFSDSPYTPEFAFMLVRKRIRARYFCLSEETGEVVNPCPGSIIDSGITSGSRPNFFLVSQNFTQGTVLPINIVVIYNNSTLSLEKIQRFTYKLTYLYYNWSGTVRVPAPCLYAHKAAYMAGQYLHAEPSASLSDKLYYL